MPYDRRTNEMKQKSEKTLEVKYVDRIHNSNLIGTPERAINIFVHFTEMKTFTRYYRKWSSPLLTNTECLATCDTITHPSRFGMSSTPWVWVINTLQKRNIVVACISRWDKSSVSNSKRLKFNRFNDKCTFGCNSSSNTMIRSVAYALFVLSEQSKTNWRNIGNQHESHEGERVSQCLHICRCECARVRESRRKDISIYA